MSTTRPQPAAPPPGLRVGDYRLLTKIGEGGMGVVHLAQAPDGSRVALKVLRPHVIGDDEARERLAREVASLRRVRSPRIAEILDADPWGPTPFVATRYVPGLSLHEQVRQEGPIRGSDLRHFAEGLAEALLAVHSVGVLHRDIKPSNVLLEGRAPVLIDFGLARLADDPRLTVTGWLLGTPGYLAPEILYGEEATTASDVHSWGATVAFAATGSPPFGRGPAMAIMDRVRRGEHHLDDVPHELQPLVRSALAPDPASRPSLPRLLADLRQRPPRRTRAHDDLTMPYAVAAALPDDDPTDVLGADRHTARSQDAQATAETLVDGHRAVPPATTPLTVVHGAAREPYMQPVPPARPVVPARRADPERAAFGAAPAPVNRAAPLQRAALVGGLLALVAMAFGLAPYLTLGGLLVGALAVRTWSWTTEASQRRAWARGRRRWYDGPLAALSSPWYLLVATGGTLLLVAWAATWAFLTGLGLLVFQAPLEPGLLAMGAVTGLAMWWGPGARRLRTPTRRLTRAATRVPWVGWLSVLLMLAAVAVVTVAVQGNGVTWHPQPGPPWRSDTLLGELVRFL